MKKFLLILLAGLLMASCGKQHTGSITSSDLQGVYEADFASYVAESLKEEGEEDPLAYMFMLELCSEMKATMIFKGDSLFTETSGGLVDFMNSISSKEDEDEIVKTACIFEIRNDSVLYTKEDCKDFEEFGIIRRTGCDFDSLILVMAEDDGSTTHVTLVRQK